LKDYQTANDKQNKILSDKKNQKELGFMSMVQELLISENYPILKKYYAALKKGIKIPSRINPMFELSQIRRMDGKIKQFLDFITNKIKSWN